MEKKVFLLNDIFSVMEQITHSTEVVKSIWLLGKRSREGERGNAECHRCGQVGHYARDNYFCFRRMKKKGLEYRSRKEAERKEIKSNTHASREKENKTKIEYQPDSDDANSDEKKENEVENAPEKRKAKKN